jgi:hypothetical protein
MLGITSLCQWDVVVFLYRHRDSLIGADHLARLLGYETELIIAAMEALEATGLVRRSRVSQGARFYHFIPPSEDPRSSALARLLAWTRRRAGRLQLSRLLPRGHQTSSEGYQAARQRPSEAKWARRRSRLGHPSHGQQKETPWLKVV